MTYLFRHIRFQGEISEVSYTALFAFLLLFPQSLANTEFIDLKFYFIWQFTFWYHKPATCWFYVSCHTCRYLAHTFSFFSERISTLYILSYCAFNYSFKYFSITILSLVLSTFVLLQVPALNYGRAFYVHLANRIHQFKWSQRTYGNFRYKLLRLRGNDLVSWLKFCLPICSQLYDNRFLTLWKKTYLSWLYQRLLTLLTLPSINIYSNVYSFPLQILLFSALAPAFLVIFKPFQGYGSSEIFITGNLPYIYLALGPIFNSSFFLSSKEGNANLLLVIIQSLLLADALSISIRWIYSVVSLFTLKASGQTAQLSSSCYKVYKNHLDCTIFIDNLLKKMPENASITIMSPEIHLFAYCNALSKYFSYTFKINKLRSVFQQIDNYSYGFYHDFVAFSVNPDLILRTIKPNLLLLDIRRPVSRQIYDSFKSTTDYSKYILYRNSGPYVIVSISRKFDSINA